MSGELRQVPLRLLTRSPIEFRQRLEALGPVFIKIGQYLALRPDLIPQEYADELLLLQDAAPPFPWAEARQILVEELGDPALFFAEINPVPMKSVCMAQVHAATLIDGTRVTIKIKRPEIQVRVLRDLKRVRLFARLANLSGWVLIAPTEAVDELRKALDAELNFLREAANMQRLRELAGEASVLRIPYVYQEVSTSRILIAESVGGIPLARALAANASERKEWGIDSERLAANLFLSTLQQIFRHRFFNGDVHPGNLKVLAGDAIGYFDFGLCSVVDPVFQRAQVRYFDALYRGDFDAVHKMLLRALTATPDSDPEGLHIDLLALSHDWQNLSMAMSAKGPSGFLRPPVAQSLTSALRAARRNGYELSRQLQTMYCTLLTSEAVAWRIGLAAELMETGGEFFTAARIHEALGVLDPDNTRSTALSILDLARDAPGQMNQILSELSKGSFQMNVQVTENSRAARSRDQRYALLTIAVASIGIAFLMGEPTLPRLGPVSARYGLAALLVFLYVRAFFLWRRMR